MNFYEMQNRLISTKTFIEEYLDFVLRDEIKSTGFPSIDRIIGGHRSATLTLLASRPGMGKSTLALNLALRFAEQHRLPTYIFTFEMAYEFILNRFKNETTQHLSELPIFICEPIDMTATDIRNECRKASKEHGKGLVIIDYIQLIKAEHSDLPREQQIADISRTLKIMAKELYCPVIAISQLNRGVESRVNKWPMLSDFRESGSLEQDADIVMMLYRDDVYNKNSIYKNMADILVVKNRFGEIGKTKLSYNQIRPRFDEVCRERMND